jgi:hypothetical protein
MSEEKGGTNEKEPSVTLRKGDRSFTVETTPLPRRDLFPQLPEMSGVHAVVEASIGPIRETDFYQKENYAFVICPSRRLYRRVLISCLVGFLGTLYFGINGAVPGVRPYLLPGIGEQIPGWVLFLLSSLCFFWFALWNYAILFGACRVRFDQDTGLMTFGPRWSRRSRPLAEIIAVQLVHDAVYETPAAKEALPEGSGKTPRYQVNLALDDASTPRLNVADCRDQVQAEEMAQQLAHFLEVPLLGHGGAGR